MNKHHRKMFYVVCKKMLQNRTWNLKSGNNQSYLWWIKLFQIQDTNSDRKDKSNKVLID